MGIQVNSKHCFWVAQVLGLIAFSFALIWTMLFRGGLSWKHENLIFNVHPLLMLLGVIGQGGLAIMSLRPLQLPRSKSYVIHLSCHSVALVTGITGVCVAFIFHDSGTGRANLYSLHSWIGIIVILLYLAQWTFGLLVFFKPKASLEFRRRSLPWHIVHGLFLYTFAVGNAALGFLERLTLLESSRKDISSSEAVIVNSTAIFTIFFGAAVIATALAEPAVILVDDTSYSAI